MAIIGRLWRSLGQTPISAKSESGWIHFVTPRYRRETNDFARVFNSFSLAVPGDSSSTSSTTEPKPNSDYELSESRKPEIEAAEKIFLDSGISQQTKGLSEVVEEVGEDFAECSEEENTGQVDSQVGASATVVALDTETEPFTDKYSQSKTWAEFRKTGKMILAT